MILECNSARSFLAWCHIFVDPWLPLKDHISHQPALVSRWFSKFFLQVKYVILLMAEIRLTSWYGSVPHYLEGFIHPRISSINRSSLEILQKFKPPRLISATEKSPLRCHPNLWSLGSASFCSVNLFEKLWGFRLQTSRDVCFFFQVARVGCCEKKRHLRGGSQF